MRIHMYHFEEAGIFQANNLLIDVKTEKELSLTEASFRISNNPLLRESKVSSFNHFNVVKAFKENETIARLEYAFQLGLTTKYSDMRIHENVDFEMLTDYMGYGQLNESVLTDAMIIERLKNLNDPLILESWFKNLVNKVGGAVSSVASKVGGAVVSGAKAVGGAVVSGAKAVGRGVVAAGKAVGKFAKGVVDTLGSWAQKLGAFATKVWETIKKVASFAGQLIVKFFDFVPGIVDSIKPVFKIIPSISTVLSIGGGISCVLKALMVKSVAENRTFDLSKLGLELNEAAITVSPALATKREKTGHLIQSVVMFACAALKIPPDSGLVNGLKTGVTLALADGKGKVMSIIPYITKNIKAQGMAGKIAEIFTNPVAMIAALVSRVIEGINVIAGKIWTAIGGEKLVNSILAPALKKLTDKFKEMMGGGAKKEEAEAPAEASAEAPAEAPKDAKGATVAAGTQTPPTKEAQPETEDAIGSGGGGGGSFSSSSGGGTTNKY